MSVFMTNVVLVVLVVIVVILAMTTWTATRARNAAAERARVNIERVSALSAEVDALRLDGIKASGQLGALYGERNAVIAAVEERLGVPRCGDSHSQRLAPSSPPAAAHVRQCRVDQRGQSFSRNSRLMTTTHPPTSITPARATDPSTSHDAAEHAATNPAHAPTAPLSESERAVLDAFVLFGAMTDEVLLQSYHRWRMHNNWPRQSDSGLRTRRKTLVTKGYLAEHDRALNSAGRKVMSHRALVATTPKPSKPTPRGAP